MYFLYVCALCLFSYVFVCIVRALCQWLRAQSYRRNIHYRIGFLPKQINVNNLAVHWPCWSEFKLFYSILIFLLYAAYYFILSLNIQYRKHFYGAFFFNSRTMLDSVSSVIFASIRDRIYHCQKNERKYLLFLLYWVES